MEGEKHFDHYATVMKAYVQRRTGQQGKERGGTATTKYPSDTGAICQPWSEFNQGKNELSSIESADISSFFIFKGKTGTALACSPPTV